MRRKGARMDRYEALKHAVKAHAGRVDKCGQLYILHPIAVAEALDAAVFSLFDRRERETMIVAAFLHDVWEDTDYNWHNGNLSRVEQIVLEGITQADGEPYAAYIERVATNPLTATIKLADLWHNLQPERQACLPEKERTSLEARYLKARDRIWEALGYEWWPEGGEG
jgi:(p)ppGpp synthase/HD superfamily hydrolase